MKKEYIGFRIDEHRKKFLESMANEDNRSLSNYIEGVLIDHIASKGGKLSNEKKTKGLHK